SPCTRLRLTIAVTVPVHGRGQNTQSRCRSCRAIAAVVPYLHHPKSLHPSWALWRPETRSIRRASTPLTLLPAALTTWSAVLGGILYGNLSGTCGSEAYEGHIIRTGPCIMVVF